MLKTRKPTLEKELAQSAHAKTVTNDDRTKERKEKEKRQSQKQGEIPEVVHPKTTQTDPNPPTQAKQNPPDTMRKSYAQVVKQTPTQSATEKPWTEVKYANKRQGMTKVTQKQEPGGRRILFPREEGHPQKSEEHIMLALNEALQKAGEPTVVQFCRVKYSQSGAISGLLTEKARAEDLLNARKNILIRAAKMVDAAVISAETLEYWQRLKVHGMPLDRYLGEGRMEIFKREVKSSTGVQLKTVPRWLIHENRLRERQESGNNRGSAIVITVASNAEATYLCAKGLRFGGSLKVVERYWEAGPGSVCPNCCGIGHDQPGKCGERPPQCTLCAGPHRLEEHKCDVSGCKVGIGKSCTHVTVRCANCEGNYQATSTRCIARQKAEKEARKRKIEKDNEKAVETPEQHDPPTEEPREEPKEIEVDMDLENWAGSPLPPLSSIGEAECQDPKHPW